MIIVDVIIPIPLPLSAILILVIGEIAKTTSFIADETVQILVSSSLLR